jgi:hypothetical protein
MSWHKKKEKEKNTAKAPFGLNGFIPAPFGLIPASMALFGLQDPVWPQWLHPGLYGLVLFESFYSA